MLVSRQENYIFYIMYSAIYRWHNQGSESWPHRKIIDQGFGLYENREISGIGKSEKINKSGIRELDTSPPNPQLPQKCITVSLSNELDLVLEIKQICYWYMYL